jgi:hypothetical protein
MPMPWEEYGGAVAAQGNLKPWEEYGSAPQQAASQPSGTVRSPFDVRGDGYDRAMNYSPRDAIGGQIRGAGSIGSTLVRPFESADANQQRRQSIDQGLTSLIGSDPTSTIYQTNKLLAEVAGTSGIGGAIAKGISMIPGAARALPTLLPAIQSGGMTANGATGAYGMATRAAGGAVNGAATAGLVDPKDAGIGAMLGAAFPTVTRVLGSAGDAIGSIFGPSSPRVNPTTLQTAKESMDAGYVIPPSTLDPSLKNRVLESISGKQATQQLTSTQNTKVTEGLTRQALGIADDAPLTQATLENLRKTAGKAYSEVSNISPQAASDLEALKQARNDASGWFKAYNRSASPNDLAKAKEFRATADTLETALENHAADAGRPELIPALRDARKQIAKTYTVSRALNDASGTVDARILGRLYEKQAPLSDGLDVAGKFASAFPKAAISPQQIGSPAVHNLNAIFAAGGGGAGATIGGMLAGPAGAGLGGAIGAAYPFVAPPIARSLMFSKAAQQNLLTQRAAQAPGLLRSSVDEALPLMYRLNPLLADRVGQ